MLGQQIIVFADHKNLKFKTFNTERVIRWRLILEEYGPELRYIKEENNVVADALSRLAMLPLESQPTQLNMTEHFGLEENDLPEDAFPLSDKNLMIHQQADKALLTKARDHKGFTLNMFCGGGKVRSSIVKDGKMVVPKTLQKRCVQWYHKFLCHPGKTRTELTIFQHFTWKNLRGDVMVAC